MLSDETTIALEKERPRYVQRGPREAFKKHYNLQHVKHLSQIVVWAAISAYGPGKIHIVEDTMNSDQYQR